MKTRAVADGDGYVLNGSKMWITERRRQHALHGDGGDRPVGRRARHHAPSSCTPTTRASRSGEKERKLGIKGSPTREIYFDDCRIPADRMIGEPGTGFTTALRTLDHTRLGIGAQAVGIAQGALDAAIAYVKERRQFGQRHRGLPGRAVHGRRHGDADRGRPPAGLRRRRRGRARRART